MDDDTGAAATRDVVVVGGSAGALAALRTMLEHVPADLPASVLVVVHGTPDYESQLAHILQRTSRLPVGEARDGERYLVGRVYVAPSDRHMMLAGDRIALRRGPSENGFRPAIDPLFRSAAVAASSRVVGVVLSGTLDDGASGLRAIKQCGGVAVIQDPSDADFPEMPLAAERIAGADYRPSAAHLGMCVTALAGSPASTPVGAGDDVRIEVLIAGLEGATMANEYRLGELSPFSCPDCNGNLWQIGDGGLVRFRCHTGHAYTADTLSELQETALERRLYEVLRGQRERAALLKQMAHRGGPRTRQSMHRRAERYEEDAALIESVLRRGHVAEHPDDAEELPLLRDDVGA